jgi:hypothetical protein
LITEAANFTPPRGRNAASIDTDDLVQLRRSTVIPLGFPFASLFRFPSNALPPHRSIAANRAFQIRTENQRMLILLK